MDADLLFHRKNVEPDGEIVEMKIWLVPQSPDKPHGLKYSLVYVREGKRVLGYDNAEGRGDHRHLRQKEYRYAFSDVDTLVQDFLSDVERIIRGEL